MTLEHAAIWTRQLETLREFYEQYFNGVSNKKYLNSVKGFESYFLRFDGGARLELMSMASIPENRNDTRQAQHLGLIHLAFGLDTMAELDQKAEEMRSAGFPILSGPRKTGDGYYEFETLDPDGNRLEVSTIWRA
jgi:lactoylglutathione lyase